MRAFMLRTLSPMDSIGSTAIARVLDNLTRGRVARHLEHAHVRLAQVDRRVVGTSTLL